MSLCAVSKVVNSSPLLRWAMAEFSAEALLQSAGKGKPLPAVVEAVANGSTLRVLLLPELTPVTVLVVGTQVSQNAPILIPAHAICLVSQMCASPADALAAGGRETPIMFVGLVPAECLPCRHVHNILLLGCHWHLQ